MAGKRWSKAQHDWFVRDDGKLISEENFEKEALLAMLADLLRQLPDEKLVSLVKR
jgi:hypothetical protein